MYLFPYPALNFLRKNLNLLLMCGGVNRIRMQVCILLIFSRLSEHKKIRMVL